LTVVALCEYSAVEMRARKHRTPRYIPELRRTLDCGGDLRTLYARVGGDLQSVGSICRVCGDVEFDFAAGEVWRSTKAGAKLSALEYVPEGDGGEGSDGG
jgi:hypothetical protein